MSRRVAKYYCLQGKIDPRSPEDRAENYDPLVWIMTSVMAPRANRRFGAAGRDSAYADTINQRAAAHSLDRVGSCQMHFTAPKGEDGLLSTAHKMVGRRKEALKGQAAAEEADAERQRTGRDVGWEPWHWALEDLLHLTRRFWTYRRLFPFRDPHCWKGPLSAVVWGPQRQQGALTLHINSFEQLRTELATALAQLHESECQDDPVTVFLKGLEGEDFTDRLRYEGWGPRRAWLNHVKKALPEPAADGSCYADGSCHPELAAALDRLRSLMLEQPGQPVLGLAWSEFTRELVEPRQLAAGQSPPANVTTVLDVFYNAEAKRRRSPESPPCDILFGILSLPRPAAAAVAPASAAPGGFNATRLLLVAHLRKSVPAGSPEDSVLTHALSNPAASFDMLRDALDPHPPPDLCEDLLEAALARLGGWQACYRAQQVKARAWQQTAAAPESYELLDLAADACHEDTLIQARTTVDDWILQPALPRPTWSRMTWDVSLAIRSAVLSACLDRLWDDMNDFFGALRSPQPWPPAAPPPSPNLGAPGAQGQPPPPPGLAP